MGNFANKMAEKKAINQPKHNKQCEDSKNKSVCVTKLYMQS